MSGFGDFFKQLFSNIGKMKDQRQPMVSDGRGGFGVFRPQMPMGNDLPEQGGFTGNLNRGDSGDSSQPTGSMLEMIMKSQRPTGSFPPAGSNPVNADANNGTDGTYSPGVDTYTGPQQMSPADQKYHQIMDILGRDYSRNKNPNYNSSDPNSQQYTYGKDYDKTHNWKDVLRGIGLGALQGGANAPAGASAAQMLGNVLGGAAGGGVSAGADRNADNKMLDQLKLRQMLPEYQAAYGLEQQRTNDALKQNQIRTATDNIITDNNRQQADLERKTSHDKAQESYWGRKADQGDLKLATDQELLDLRDKWAGQRNSVNNRRVTAIENELKERSRHNQVTEQQAATNEQGRNTRFGTAQQNQMSRQQIGIAAKQAAANLKAAVASGQMERAAQLRKELEDYKSQLTLGSTPQQ